MKEADYILFVDESFEGWFGFHCDTGNFCHAGITVPRDRITDLERFVYNLKVMIEKSFEKICPATEIKEVKYGYVKKLPDDVKLVIADKIRYFCKKNKAYCFGFYSQLTPLLYNHLRDKYSDCSGSLAGKVTNIRSEMDDIVEKLRSEKQNQPKKLGDFFILKDTYLKLTQFALNFHQSIGKTFVIQYDPRQRKEDAALNRAAVELANCVTEKILNNDNILLDYDTSMKSEECPGLMLADFIAGDLRTLFKKYPILMSMNSSFEILSAKDPQNLIPCPSHPLGAFSFKQKPLPEENIKAVIEDKSVLFSRIFDCFAQGTISCYAKYGEARHIRFLDKIILDATD